MYPVEPMINNYASASNYGRLIIRVRDFQMTGKKGRAGETGAAAKLGGLRNPEA